MQGPALWHGATVTPKFHMGAGSSGCTTFNPVIANDLGKAVENGPNPWAL